MALQVPSTIPIPNKTSTLGSFRFFMTATVVMTSAALPKKKTLGSFRFNERKMNNHTAKHSKGTEQSIGKELSKERKGRPRSTGKKRTQLSAGNERCKGFVGWELSPEI